MTDKEKFCRSFEWIIVIDWFDLVGYSSVDENRRAKITLDYLGHHDHYIGFWVSILNKLEGVVDKKFFRFGDYLEIDESVRHDSALQVIGHCGWHWYISKPKNTRPICEAIEKYIGVFR